MRQLSAAVSSDSRAAMVEPLEDRVLFSRALGVDVSSYQGTINWTSVKAAGRSFAIVKATEGKTFNSSTFTSQITGAKNAGVLVGAYHFARYDLNTAAAEASHFLAVAGKYVTAGYLRPVLDVEHSTSLSKTALSNWVNAWCTQVKSATGVAPIIYSYVSYASAHLNSTVTQWPLWMAQYPSSPAPQTGAPRGTSPWTSWSFWQYTDHASVAGISGGVDGDVYNGDLTSLKA
jgi:GH25 family lysozyme M1 (1,4-beta-N-acetylmuramidase)